VPRSPRARAGATRVATAARRGWSWLTALAGAGFEAATLAGFVVALYHPLFGFQDSIRAPLAYPAMVVESVGAVVLAAAALMMLGRGRPSRTRGQ
jgi:hypothetical protein